jgi:hypothetical protein
MFSTYLDGAVTGRQMREMADHLEHCAGCSAEYARWRLTQHMVAKLGRRQAPPELAQKLRLALSVEASLRRRSRLEGLRVRFQDALSAIMLPATAGVVSAIICFGLLIGFLAMPGQLLASGDDVPTVLYTPPQLQALPANLGISVPNADPLVLETIVDANGRVQDYRIISGDEHELLRPELNNIMIFTTFRPATSFGVPTTGRAVISIAKINVKG